MLAFHVISGLPRSGSTLLAALLAQNPAIRAGMTSPVGTLVGRVQEALGPRSDYAALVTDEQRRDVLRGLIEGFYRGSGAGRHVIDTHRVWCSRLPLLKALYPDARVVVLVRDPLWITDSFERVLRRAPLRTSTLFQPKDAVTAATRAAALWAPNGAAGFAWGAVQEAFYGADADRLLVVDYEALARAPQRTLDRIYARLGLDPFAHDVANVVYGEGADFDARLGLPGLHAVGRRVGFVERPTILPPEIAARFAGRSFWRDPDANPCGVEVVLP